MTEKRYELYEAKDNPFINEYDDIESVEWYVIDNTKSHYDLGHQICKTDVVDLLNSLSDENEQLKKELVHKKVLLDSLQDKYSGLLKLVHGFGDGDD